MELGFRSGCAKSQPPADLARYQAGNLVEPCRWIVDRLTADFQQDVSCLMPARSAGPPAKHPGRLGTPLVLRILKVSASSGVMSCTSTPIQPRTTPPWRMICPNLFGETDPEWRRAEGDQSRHLRESSTLLMPIRLPAGVHQSAPPEFFRLIAASHLDGSFRRC